MDISKDSALRLLEQMCAEAAIDFEDGVIAYLDAVAAETKALKSFKRACTVLATARKHKYNALQVIIPEYAFLMGKEPVKPEIDGRETAIQLLVKIVERLDEDLYSDIADIFIDENEEV